jgi:glutathione synthase/RimK-type ligase-like ATP-grasp enzyme
MEYIQNAPHEYRVHVFNGKSIRISEKAFFGREGNHRLYTTIKPTGQIDHVRSAAKLAVEALGLDFGAVDILANDENCWVLEVNSAPSLGGSMPQLYAQAFEEYFNDCA